MTELVRDRRCCVCVRVHGVETGDERERKQCFFAQGPGTRECTNACLIDKGRCGEW